MTDEVENQQQQADAEAEKLKKAEEEKKASDTTDYKAELEKVKKQLGEAEHKLIRQDQERQKKDELPADDSLNEDAAAEIARKEANKILTNVFKSQARVF